MVDANKRTGAGNKEQKKHMNSSHQMINQDSGSVEYYTPAYIVEAAREAMGSIGLDPASCEKANQIVQAAVYYDNGEI